MYFKNEFLTGSVYFTLFNLSWANLNHKDLYLLGPVLFSRILGLRICKRNSWFYLPRTSIWCISQRPFSPFIKLLTFWAVVETPQKHFLQITPLSVMLMFGSTTFALSRNDPALHPNTFFPLSLTITAFLSTVFPFLQSPQTASSRDPVENSEFIRDTKSINLQLGQYITTWIVYRRLFHLYYMNVSILWSAVTQSEIMYNCTRQAWISTHFL